MNIVTQEIEYCKLKVNYTASESVVEEKEWNAIKQFQKNRISGFRKGKANPEAIKVKFKKQISDTVKAELLNQANDDILFETKIRPIGQPQISNVKFQGKTFECELVYWNKPKFDLKEVKGIEVISPHEDKNVQDVAAQFLEEIRVNNGTNDPYTENDFIQKGDKITLSYKLSNGTEEEGVLYEVGSSLFSGFDENIYGMSLDESRDFNITVDGNVVKCNVLLHMGMKKKPAALNDELAKKYGLSSLEELMKTVDTVASNNLKNERNGKIAQQITAKLIQMHDFEVPEWLYMMESRHLANQSGIDWDSSTEEVKNSFVIKARDNVKSTLILDSVQEEIPEAKVSEMEAVEGIKNLLRQRGHSDVDDIINQYSKNGSLLQMIAKFKNDYALQWLVDNANIVEG